MKNGARYRRAHGSSHSGNRRDSERKQQEYPDHGIDAGRDGQQGNKDAEKGSDALAATELEPHRVQMPNKRPGGSAEGGFGSNKTLSDEDRGGRFEAIERERERREEPAPGPKDVRRADVTGADLPDVAFPGEARQHQPERNRPEQVAERQRKEQFTAHPCGE